MSTARTLLALLSGCAAVASAQFSFGVTFEAEHASTFDFESDLLEKGAGTADDEELIVLTVFADATFGRSELKYVFTKNPDPTDAQAAHPTARVFSVDDATLTTSSTVVMAFLEKLDAYQKVTAFASQDNIFSETVRTYLSDNGVVEPSASSAYSEFAAVDATAHLVDSFSYSGADTGFDGEGQADRVVLIDESRETTPLGRAEWIKVIGMLVGKHEEANNFFTTIKSQYYQMSQTAADFVGSDERPTVINGQYFADWANPGNYIFYPSGNQTYQAQLIRDAIANYAVPNSYSSSSSTTEAEEQAVLMNTDVWLGAESEDDPNTLTSYRSWLKHAKAVKCDRVFLWLAQSRVTGGGWVSSNFYEAGVVNPHLVLQDMIRVIHNINTDDLEYANKMTPLADREACPDTASPPPSSSPSSPPPAPPPPMPPPSEVEAVTTAISTELLIVSIVLSAAVCLAAIVCGYLGYFRGRTVEAGKFGSATESRA